jgi:hypothetical protein
VIATAVASVALAPERKKKKKGGGEAGGGVVSDRSRSEAEGRERDREGEWGRESWRRYTSACAVRELEMFEEPSDESERERERERESVCEKDSEENKRNCVTHHTRAHPIQLCPQSILQGSCATLNG